MGNTLNHMRNIDTGKHWKKVLECWKTQKENQKTLLNAIKHLGKPENNLETRRKHFGYAGRKHRETVYKRLGNTGKPQKS